MTEEILVLSELCFTKLQTTTFLMKVAEMCRITSSGHIMSPLSI